MQVYRIEVTRKQEPKLSSIFTLAIWNYLVSLEALDIIISISTRKTELFVFLVLVLVVFLVEWVRSSYVSAYAYAYVAAVFTCTFAYAYAYAYACAYALVKTSL